MIENREAGEVTALLASLEEDSPERRVVAMMEQSQEGYRLNPALSGLDASCTGEVKGVSNRANIKVFSPDDETLVVFFYKKSNVPWSRDRFAYGGIEYKREDSIDDTCIRSWLAFAESGFSPEARPEGLIRLFPYDIPA